MYSTKQRLLAEAVGTFVLVFFGTGSAVLAAQFNDVGIGTLGVAFAFGLSVLTMSAAFSRISGAHFNPAVSVGLFLAKRFPARDVVPYIIVQVFAAILASGLVLLIARGIPSFFIETGFAANGYAEHSPVGYPLLSVIGMEITVTAVFVLVVLAVTDPRAPNGLAPVAIGLALTLAHLVGMPVTNMSVNPARSTGPAIYVGGWALAQLWAFWVFPLIGSAVAALIYRLLATPAVIETPTDVPIFRPRTTPEPRPS